MDIKINWNDVLSGLDSFGKEMNEKILRHSLKKGLEMESYAKANAPWQDITGEARRSIKGEAKDLGDKVEISISGNKEYSPYLEYKNDGKYAILNPTVNQFSSKIFEGLKVD